jgi:hypothetical protein
VPSAGEVNASTRDARSSVFSIEVLDERKRKHLAKKTRCNVDEEREGGGGYEMGGEQRKGGGGSSRTGQSS